MQSKQIYLALLFASIAHSTLATGAHAAEKPDIARFVTLQTISDGDPTTDDRGWGKIHINATSYKTQSLATKDEYQFVSYYGADGKLIIGRRKLTADPQIWTLLRTEFTSFNINDAHNVSSLAIDGNGFLHLAWGVHNNRLLYTQSTSSVLSDQPLHVIGESEGNAGCLTDSIPLQQNRVTYPEFYNFPDSGDLLLTFRTGSSGHGKFQLFHWDNATRAWSSIHAGLGTDGGEQPWIDDKFHGDRLPNVSAYYNKIVFDRKGRMHVSWSWRTGGDSHSGFNDYQTNHNIMYAFSDNGGIDWHRDDGSLYQRKGIHQIDESNATPVLQIAEGSSLINQTSSAVDSKGRYYTATWYAPEAANGDHLRQYMLIEFDGATWKTHQVGSRKGENNHQRIPEAKLSQFTMRRPVLAVDGDDRVMLFFSDYQRGGGVTVAYREDPDRNDWQFIDLSHEKLGRSDPTIDLCRWQRDGVFSMFHQPAALGNAAEVAAVLEWNARAYFASQSEAKSSN